MIGVFIVPTGIGAEIGGHAGDANAAARLIAGCCDKLLVHPNVVNASDFNEMTPNMLYVEGSTLDRFLEGQIRLQEVYSNKILVVGNPPLSVDTVYAVEAARVTLGVDVYAMELETPLVMQAELTDQGATGKVGGAEELIQQVQGYVFDALAIHTPVNAPREVVMNYYERGGVNPWGGVEAQASRMISEALGVPVAHAPIESLSWQDRKLVNEMQIDPRFVPEVMSTSHLFSVLKGLHRAPRIEVARGLSVRDVHFMITPAGCFGRPHTACLKRGIPVIVVAENQTCLSEFPHPSFLHADNYLEAAGLVIAMRQGIAPEAVRRPIGAAKILKSA